MHEKNKIYFFRAHLVIKNYKCHTENNAKSILLSVCFAKEKISKNKKGKESSIMMRSELLCERTYQKF